jgi:hypothetical protein
MCDFSVAGAIMFEKPLGALNGSQRERDEAHQWIQANIDIFKLNASLKVASPLFKIFPIRAWRKLVKAEDTFHQWGKKRKKSMGLIHYGFSFGQKHLLTALQKMEDLVNTGDLKEQMSFLTTMISREEISRNDLMFFVQSMFSDGLATVSFSVKISRRSNIFGSGSFNIAKLHSLLGRAPRGSGKTVRRDKSKRESSRANDSRGTW